MSGPGAPLATAVAIVLCAGRSSRAGEPKGLIAVEGRPFVLWQLEALPGRAIVVLGHHGAAYRAVLPAGVEIAVNDAPDRGPFSSVQIGARRALAAGAAGAFVLPVDVPAGGPAVFEALARAAARPGVVAAIPEHAGRGGHPVLCARALLERLAEVAEGPDYRLDAQLRALPPGAVARVATGDPRVTLNFNVRADYDRRLLPGLDLGPSPSDGGTEGPIS